MISTKENPNILVVAAHPDDEVLGCGGTIARMAQQGSAVYVAILGEGVTARYKEPKKADPSLLESLHGISRKVAHLLGAKDLFMFGLPDNRFDTVPLIDVVKTVEELVEKTSPEIIFTHHMGDLNIDHQIVSRAVLTATRPVSNKSVKSIYAFEVPSSTEWAFQRFEPSFKPNFFVNIEKTIEPKLKGMSLYESEARPFPHPRSPEALRAISARWGSVVGHQAAEAFELIRTIY